MSKIKNALVGIETYLILGCGFTFHDRMQSPRLSEPINPSADRP